MRKMVGGTLILVFPDGYTEPCLIESNEKNGFQGLLVEIQKLFDAIQDLDAQPVPIDYSGAFEMQIQIAFGHIFDQAMKLRRILEA
jgi:hypothetical protein